MTMTNGKSRLQQAVQILLNCGMISDEAAAQVLSKDDDRAVIEFCRQYRVSLDWLWMGNPGPMLCRAAKNEGGRP